MALNDQELMLLEQLMYLEDLEKNLGITINDKSSVSVIIEQLDDVLDTLDKTEKIGELGRGYEWAGIIRAIQDNEALMRLKIVDIDQSSFSYCFVDPTDPDRTKAYVAFKGTSGAEEWYDNFQGGWTSDTKCQKEALDFIESLPYEKITVVGHSKGGNKAQYVTLVSDKVEHCISMDGQGFSQEFLDKYSAEISKRGSRIKSCSLSTDYVHILMFPVPGAEQSYCKGDSVGVRNHCPSSFFQYYFDSQGKARLKLDGSGSPDLRYEMENEGMTYLHEFTSFLMNVLPTDSKELVLQYLGVMVTLMASGDDQDFLSVSVDGIEYTRDEVMKYLMSDSQTFLLILLCAVKYADTYGLSEKQLRALLRAFGFEKLLEKMEKAWETFQRWNPIAGAGMKIGGISFLAVLKMLLHELDDGKRDPLIEFFLSWWGNFLEAVLHIKVNFVEAWRGLEANYTTINVPDKQEAISDGKITETKVFDYSRAVFDKLLWVISSIEAIPFDTVSIWNTYSGEPWYEPLEIASIILGVDGYADCLSEMNADCKRQIESIFDRVAGIDRNKSDEIKEIQEILSLVIQKAGVVASALGD